MTVDQNQPARQKEEGVFCQSGIGDRNHVSYDAADGWNFLVLPVKF